MHLLVCLGKNAVVVHRTFQLAHVYFTEVAGSKLPFGGHTH